MARKHINGILNLYWFPPDGFAPAMMEHIKAFGVYSGHQVYSWNTAYGLPDLLKQYEFSAINLHYSLFGGPIHWIDEAWCDYLISMTNAFKSAVFQDEYRFWGLRYELLESLPIDLVYTCFKPEWHQATYYKHGWKGKALYALTGYVGDDMVSRARSHALPDADRHIDVGYRARQLEEYMGRGAMEKHYIAKDFIRYAVGGGLSLDISTAEADRIYGNDWYEFLGSCKACLGVEAGVSVVDTDDVLWPLWRRMMDENPDMDFEQFSSAAGLKRWEDVIYLRTISPRHFECAAIGTCQVLFEGKYSDVMQPGVHYIELKKDFSNIDSVLDTLARPDSRHEITARAYKDLIDSDKYHYKTFMGEYSEELNDVGIRAGVQRDTSLDTLLNNEQAAGYECYTSKGEWVGPHLHPRPNWPKNLGYLKDKKLTISESGKLVVED